jgi:hypothetical protein
MPLIIPTMFYQPRGVFDSAVGGGGGSTALNPSDKAAAITLTGSNLIATGGPGMARSVASYSTGKYYFEVLLGAGSASYDHCLGLANSSASLTAGPGSPDLNSIGYYNGDPAIYANNVSAGSTGLTAVGGGPNDLVSVAIDVGGSLMWIRLNGGNWNNNGSNNPATGVGGINVSAVSKPWFAFVYGGTAATTVNTINFGSTAYSFTAPSGFGNM